MSLGIRRAAKRRLGAGVGLCATLLAGAGFAAHGPVVWAQSSSDVPVESDVRFGVLANGVRYAIMHNATPPGQTALRLRIGAGSLQERDDQRGLAHFLEHMAFKGSTHVREGEMLKILQRKGLAFGPDSNAFTLFDQTFFKLDLPGSDDDRIDTGLMLLREVGGELSLKQAAMDAERGVVLSEERLRGSPAKALGDWQRDFVYEGQRVAARDPIGLVDILKTAPVSLIRQYYEAYYRPENATVIAVGDFDPDAMEAKIKARFGDWRGRGKPGAQPNMGRPMARGETFRMLIGPGIPGLYAVTWAQPFDAEPDTSASERRHVIEDIGIGILNRRLSRVAESPMAPFLSASFSRANILHSARLTSLSLICAPHTLDHAVGAAILEQRRIVRYGVTQPELDEAIANIQAVWTAAAAGASTRATAALADGLLGSVNADTVFKSPQQSLDLIVAVTRDLKPADVDATLKTAFVGSGPLIAAAFPGPLPEGAAGLKADYDNAAAAPLADTPPLVVKPWPYASARGPGVVTMRQVLADLGVTQVTFANGLRLNVKTTAFAMGEIQIAAKFGDGVLGLPPGDTTPLWMVNALAPGGTTDLSADDVRMSLAGVVAGASFSVGDSGFGLGSATRSKDFPRDLQLITALFEKPGFRPEAVDRFKASISVSLPTLETTPGGVLGKSLELLLHRGDARWRGTPDAPELAKATAAQLPAVMAPILKSAPLELSIVGDVTVDQAISAVAATLGALPPRDDPHPVPPANRTVTPPSAAATPVVLTHKGRADQAIAFIAWPTSDFHADHHRARILELSAKVLENRLVERLRDGEAVTYTPSAVSVASSDLLNFGYVAASVEIPPQKIDGFYRDLDDIVADLAAAPPTADEFERARAPVIETALKLRETNGFWLGLINGSQVDPRRLTTARTRIADLRSVTPADVQSVVAQFLRPGRGWKLIVRPETLAAAPGPVNTPLPPPAAPTVPPPAPSANPAAHKTSGI